MTKLQKKVTSLLVTVRTIEQLNIDKSKATTRVAKKKFKLQLEAYLLDLDEKIRDLKLQDFRDFKQELKSVPIAENDGNDDDK